MVTFQLPGPCPVLNVSYKPQKISPKSQGTVRQLLHERIRDAYIHPQFVADVMKPLMIENIIDQEVSFARTILGQVKVTGLLALLLNLNPPTVCSLCHENIIDHEARLNFH